MEDLKTYFTEKAKEHYGVLKAFQKSLNEDPERMNALQSKIADYKTKNPAGTYLDVRVDIVELVKTHYNYVLINQSYQARVLALHEIAVMAKVTGMELGIDEELKKVMEGVMAETPFVHAEDKGEAVFVDNTSGKAMKHGLEEKINSEEALKQVYDGFVIERN